MADSAVIRILDSAVVLDMTDGAVAGVLHGAVLLDVADSPVVGILNSAVVLQMADGAVVGVLDGAILLDVAHGAVGLVLDGAVGLDGADRLVAGIGDLLRVARDGGEQQDGKQKRFEESEHVCVVCKFATKVSHFSNISVTLAINAAREYLSSLKLIRIV